MSRTRAIFPSPAAWLAPARVHVDTAVNEGLAALGLDREEAPSCAAAGDDTPMAATTSIVARASRLSHQAAEDLCERIVSDQSGRTVVLDLNNAEEVSTAAFARLVLLRRDLLREGRDLRLRGLHSRARSVWRISRLANVLPLQ